MSSPNFQKMYSKEQLDHCRGQNHCPDNDRLCGEAVWMYQNCFLGPRSDMNEIAGAIEKLYINRGQTPSVILRTLRTRPKP